MQRFNKAVALLLCLMMLIGLMPVNALAVGTDAGQAVDAALFFSDLHTSQNNYKESEIKAVMEGVTSSGLDFSAVTSVGDAFSSNETAYTGATAPITAAIREGLGDADVPVYYAWSDHDRGADIENFTGLMHSGENYYIYAISMSDMSSSTRYNQPTTFTEEKLTAFTETVEELDHTKPLFIVSHLPLHDRRDDNQFADEWYGVISAAAEKMDVVFLWGHNHTSEGTADVAGYYVAKDGTEKMTIQDVGSVIPNFTYLNAGYMSPASTGWTDDDVRQELVVAAAIYDDSINFTTYDKNGVCTGSDAMSETVVREFAAETEPEVPETAEPVEDVNNTGITVSAPGVTGVTVDVLNVELPEGYTAYASFDITVEGHVDGVEATVSVPAPEGFDTEKAAVVLYDGELIARDPDITDGITFTTDHFSVYDVAQTAAEDLVWTQISEAQNKTIFRLTDSLTSGNKYVIVNRNTAGNGNAVTLNRSGNSYSIGNTSVTVVADTAGNYIDAPADSAQWTFNSNSKLQNVGTTSRYLYASGSNEFDVTSSSSTNYTTWTYSTSNGLRARRTSSSTTYRTFNNYYIYVAENIKTEELWAAMKGQTAFTFAPGEYDVAEITNALTVYTATDSNGTNQKATTDYEIIGDVAADEAGDYTLTVNYGGKKLGEIEVHVVDKRVTGITVEPMVGSVVRGSANDAVTGSEMTVTYDDGSTKVIPVTVGMLGGSFDIKTNGSYAGLTVNYGGASVEGYTLNVVNVVGNNYPEYPNEGAVKVNKTGTGIDFQSSGIAQVEISASGVPMKQGADIIVMLDTSSSMNSNKVKDDNGNTTSKTRLQVLQEALDAMVADFQAGNSAGEDLDLRLAIADFNGYYDEGSGTPYDQDEDDYHGRASYDQDANDSVYTGDGTLTAGAFVDINELTTVPTLGYTSGTNYDYAFDAIYQLGTAIKAENAKKGENRDLYVIFMSDGAAFQWNYYHSRNDQGNWGKWITGQYTTTALVQSAVSCNTHAYYYDFVDHDNDGQLNEHRMANAIKGEVGKDYEIIRKSEAGLPEGTLTPVSGKENLYTVPGLDATMFTINFDAQTDGSVEQADIRKSLASTASDQTDSVQYYYEINTVSDLGNAFDTIGSDIAYAAYNARYVDQMGDDYNLQMAVSNYSVVNGSTTTNKTINPKIEIISYDIYTRQDFLNDLITEDKIGDRKGTFKVLETVTFNADGTEAYSDKKSGNILINGVIHAQNFWYNTTAAAVPVEGVSIPTGKDSANLTTGSTNMLPAETFYWRMGTVRTSELAMRYHVYLEGSMEGTRQGGSYPTNEYATLFYDNYLGNPAYKDTVSPVMPWKEANVSYAFYLVDRDGKIIVNQTTGDTGSFANKIAITNPVVHSTLTLNSGTDVNASVLAQAVLPSYYKLYDSNAAYKITINSNSTGAWEITQGANLATTTYVTQFDPNDPTAYSTKISEDTVGNDYTHTVVWFAVVFEIQAHPDTVVIDYGLPVDISVLANDMFGEKGKLAAVGALDKLPAHYDTAADGDDNLASGFAADYTGTYGTAKADEATGEVRYTLNTSNGMQMQTYEKFAYAVNYTGETNPGYFYDTVTVIPATTIYFEDNFLTFAKYKADGTADGTWGYEGSTDANAVQDEDRPGQYSLTDANNIYGYDAVNLGMSTFSQGQARKVHVDADSYATASFSFYGTGFDVISMTSNTTGTIAVKVTNAAGERVASKIVNTYYGYTMEGDKWVPAPDVENSLYQVPVLQIEELPYGKYDVVITATYMAPSDKTTADGYDLYLDAIRIYDPANDGAADGTADTTIEKAYADDHEGWPSYIELRNSLIAAEAFDQTAADTKVEGMVFIDGDAEVGTLQLRDYIAYGPNNEVYLAPGQRVAFLVSDVTRTGENGKTESIVDRVHLGIKSADGNTVTYTIANIAQNTNVDTGVKAGDRYAEKIAAVNTATDMYYDITGYRNDIIVIANTGNSGILSITNIKSTYKSDPSVNSSVAPQSVEDERFETYIYMTAEAAAVTMKAMEPKPVNPFADINSGDFFYESVLWAVENGITNGVDAAHFGPYLNCNRAQVVTFLWRAAGSPAPASRENPFTDVPENSWYTDAVLWAVENGITNGLSATTFGPDALCNRAQVVTFLWRANGSKQVSAANPFTDVPADAFYRDAVVWALANGITTGATATTFNPAGICMRAHVVTFLYRAEQLADREVN